MMRGESEQGETSSSGPSYSGSINYICPRNSDIDLLVFTTDGCQLE